MHYQVCPLDEIDFYKAGHYAQYPNGTMEIYSNMTPRSSRTPMTEVLVAGLNKAILDIHFNWLDNFFKLTEEQIKEKLSEYQYFMDKTIYEGAVTTDHIMDVWKLGYMPLEIKAIPDGTLVPVKVPIVTIRNTHPSAFWLVNYLETKLSNIIWKSITSATTAYQFLRNFHAYADITGADKSFIPFQGHDFSYRGMSGNEDAISSGLGHLFCFVGTDTVPAIKAAKYYDYGDWKKELVGCSVVATEHSVMCAGSKDGEFQTFERLLEKFPTNILSVVSDTWDYWKVITDYLPRLKDKVMKRNGRLVIRPDSGDPVRIICGYPIFTDRSEIHCCYDGEDAVYLNKGNYLLYKWDEKSKKHINQGIIPEYVAKGTMEILWEIFGGTTNSKGFKSLSNCIGLIYGDSITIDRQEKILQLLLDKGFTADNLVLGIGSFSYEYVTRDTYGFAMKATNIVQVEKVPDTELSYELISRPIFKDPKTQEENFSKKSARGYLRVDLVNGVPTLFDQLDNIEDTQGGMLEVKYFDGKITGLDKLSIIRERVLKSLYESK